MNRITPFALAVLSLAPLAAVAASETMRQVDVVVDMTDAGRKLIHPTPEHPAYYFPIIGGYKEMGALVAGEKPPDPNSVIHVAAIELAKAGYLTCLHHVEGTPAAGKTPAKPGRMEFSHQPDLLIIVHWGYLNPMIDNMSSDPDDPSGNVFFNQGQMLALVGGNTLSHLDLNFEREDVMQAAEVDRYFIIISAYDAHAYFQAKKKVELWRAKMSVPSNRVDFSDVMTALVKAGGPFLGRETYRPKMLMAPLTPEGHVEVGTPTVKDYQDVPPPPPRPAAAATSASPSPSPTANTPPAHTPQ